MGSILIYKGMPPLSDEQMAEIEALRNMKDEDIDYSDIPPLTEEDFKRMRRPKNPWRKVRAKVISIE